MPLTITTTYKATCDRRGCKNHTSITTDSGYWDAVGEEFIKRGWRLPEDGPVQCPECQAKNSVVWTKRKKSS